MIGGDESSIAGQFSGRWPVRKKPKPPTQNCGASPYRPHEHRVKARLAITIAEATRRTELPEWAQMDQVSQDNPWHRRSNIDVYHNRCAHDCGCF